MRMFSACASLLLAVMLIQGCWMGANTRNTATITPATPDALSSDVMKQTQKATDQKSVGRISCHGRTDVPTMHRPQTVRLGCIDCYGGDPNVLVTGEISETPPSYQEGKQGACSPLASRSLARGGWKIFVRKSATVLYGSEPGRFALHQIRESWRSTRGTKHVWSASSI